LADITMPQLGETVTEGTVTRWLKKVGDPVAEDEVLFEVSTDKVDSEVPSPASGYLAEILVPEGETVAVGTKLAVITAEPPQAVGQASAGGAGAAAPSRAEAAPAPAATAPSIPQGPAVAPPAQAPPSPAPPAQAPPPGAPEPALASAGAAPPVGRAPVPGREGEGNGRGGAVASAPAVPGTERGGGRVLSPVVRRLLAEHRIDPAEVPGTGAGGRITRADVLRYIDLRRAGAAPSGPSAPSAAGAVAPPTGPPPAAGVVPTAVGGAPAAPAAAPSPPAPISAPASGPVGAPGAPLAAAEGGLVVSGRDEVVPFTNIRRRTAEHMVRSKATSAHTLTAVEVDFEAVERVRRAAQERFRAEEGFSLTYLPFVALATVEALRAYPHLNASVGEDALIVHHDIHLGIAVDLDHQGLIVPVVRHADTKRLRALAREIVDLANRARTKRLLADDIAGGTFTITNPGPYGTFMTVPIINQPQVAILSTDGVRRRPVVVTAPDGTEAIAIHSVGVLALSFDHRAVDGAYASAFLARLREVLETRDWAAEL
jgi:pyruvate dehydrogenase E2 component (dihydrolipoamide acetyltransferase)